MKSNKSTKLTEISLVLPFQNAKIAINVAQCTHNDPFYEVLMEGYIF